MRGEGTRCKVLRRVSSRNGSTCGLSPRATYTPRVADRREYRGRGTDVAMRFDVFDHLKGHYASVADELRSKAEQTALLINPGDVGTDREGVYRAFLERHLPKTCDVFLGGYLFDLSGKSSSQMDVIVTSGNTPRFRMQDGSRHIAPLEGSVAVAEVKSRLDRDSLRDALEKCASIPRMPDRRGIVPLYLKVPEE